MSEFTLIKSSNGELKEKGSRFYAISEPASTLDQVKIRLLEIKQMFPGASHICYAYRIKIKDRLDEFAIDDGEPRGSAGKPILNVLPQTGFTKWNPVNTPILLTGGANASTNAYKFLNSR